MGHWFWNGFWDAFHRQIEDSGASYKICFKNGRFRTAHGIRAWTNHLIMAAMSILGFGRKEGRIFMHIKSALNWRAQVSNILCTLSCFFTFIVLPLYILGFAFERENLLQLIWPLSSAWPSLLTILLCFACIRGTCAHREYFAWQFAYILLLLFPFVSSSFITLQRLENRGRMRQTPSSG